MSKYDEEKRRYRRKQGLKGFVLVGCLTGALIGGVSYNIYTHTLKYFEKQLLKHGAYITDETEYGTIDTEKNPLAFSLVNIGSYKEDVFKEHSDILKDTSIPTGLIASPTSDSLSKLYDEADYALKIISEYEVDYPVFLNIDSLFETYINNTDDINGMVNEYVKKLQTNGCYVTVVGHKNYMDMLREEKYKVSQVTGEEIDYPIGLIVDNKIENVNEEIYDVIIGEDYACVRTNFKSLIKGNYNKEKLFVDNYEYIVEPGDNLSLISDEVGLSVDVIKQYNCISDTIYPGQSIVIPNKYLPPYYRGIDVSSNNGEIDWNKVSENIDFALLRVGYTANSKELDSPCVIDEYFHYNITECNNNNIPVGVYYTSKNYDKFRMESEANALLRQLISFDISLPIYINIPAESQLHNEETRRNIIECVDYFCTIISDNGYTPGIYVHESLVPFIPELKDKYTIWSYGGLHYNERQKYNDMYFDYKVDEDVPIFQPTIAGDPSVVGITDSFWLGYDYANRDVLNEWLKDKNAKVKRFRNR